MTEDEELEFELDENEPAPAPARDGDDVSDAELEVFAAENPADPAIEGTEGLA